jgi:hypothetical protein
MGNNQKDEKKIRKCKGCGKQLLDDEKFPFCLRCRLSGRNNGTKFLGIAAGFAGIFAIAEKIENEGMQ